MAEGEGAGRKPGVTNAEIEKRKHIVFELMLQGYRPPQVFDLIVANRALKSAENANDRKRYRPDLDWDVQPNQVGEYYRDATERLREMNLEDGRSEFRKSVIRNDDLYRRALAAGDLSTCRQLEKDRRLLLGLDAFEHGVGKSSGPVVQRTAIELPGGQILEI